jgi:hypothetical protein
MSRFKSFGNELELFFEDLSCENANPMDNKIFFKIVTMEQTTNN